MALIDKLTAIGDAIREKTGDTAKLKLDAMPEAIRNIEGSGGMDDTLVTFDQQNAQVTAYLADADAQYTDSNYSTVSVVGNYASADKNYDDPAGKALTTETGTIHFADETDGAYSWHDSCGATYTAYNLIPGHTYRWYVVSDGKTTQGGKLAAVGKVRMVYAEGVDNARDLGGFAANGGTVKYGILYRGYDGHYNNSLIAAMRKCGVKCEVDLQEENDVNRNNQSFFGDDVIYKRYPMEAYYLDAINLSGAAWPIAADAISGIMESAALGAPTYFHCSLGADRTGIIGWMLQAILGMSAADCDKSYELTAFAGKIYGSDATTRTRKRLATSHDYLKTLSPTSLESGALAWCARAGISARLINQYRRTMIDGSPAEVTLTNTITANLTGATLSNNAATVTNGDRYATTISGASGYAIQDVTVRMAGKNVTSMVYDPATKTVTIPEVCGDLVIDVVTNSNVANIQYTLTNCTVESAPEKVDKGSALSVTITPETYHHIDTVAVKMGGAIVVDAYSGGVVTIPSVSGDVEIMATAAANFVNQINIATDTDGSIYPFQRAYFSSSGAVSANSSDSRHVTGFIPVKSGDVVRLDGFLWQNATVTDIGGKTCNSGNQRAALYDANKQFLALISGNSIAATINNTAENTSHGVLDGGNNLAQFTVGGTKTSVAASARYIRFALCLKRDDPIVTINEPIE